MQSNAFRKEFRKNVFRKMQFAYRFISLRPIQSVLSCLVRVFSETRFRGRSCARGRSSACDRSSARGRLGPHSGANDVKYR